MGDPRLALGRPSCAVESLAFAGPANSLSTPSVACEGALSPQAEELAHCLGRSWIAAAAALRLFVSCVIESVLPKKRVPATRRALHLCEPMSWLHQR